MAAERRELREALDDASAQLTQLREAGAPRMETTPSGRPQSADGRDLRRTKPAWVS